MDITHERLLNGLVDTTVNLRDIEPQRLLALYRFMVRLRVCQEAIIEEYHPADEMRCPVHFCIGQESVPAAVHAVIKDDDFLFSHHRSHGYYFAKGGDLNEFFAELYGKAAGSDGGLSGSQEISAPGIRFYSGAIITGMTASAVGTAFGLKMKGSSAISIAGAGDGATEEGLFWESISYSVLKKLPVLFICENNRYSTYSPLENRQAEDDIHDRVAAFGLRVETIFGNDPAQTYLTIKDAVDFVRNGGGPCFVEAYTYRQTGHVGPEGDDYVGYRSQEERDWWAEHCPIRLFETPLMEAGVLTPQLKSEVYQDAQEDMADAIAFAKETSFPEPPTDWGVLNLPAKAPAAEGLLCFDASSEQFNQHQQDTIPGPY